MSGQDIEIPWTDLLTKANRKEELRRRVADLREDLHRRRKAGWGFRALTTFLNERLREAVLNIRQLNEEYRARKAADPAIADRATVESGVSVLVALKDAEVRAYAISARTESGLSEPWRVIKEGLEKLAEGDDSFRRWTPVTWDRVRDTLRDWTTGRKERKGRRRSRPARYGYAKEIAHVRESLANDYARLRALLEGLGTYLPANLADFQDDLDRAELSVLRNRRKKRQASRLSRR